MNTTDTTENQPSKAAMENTLQKDGKVTSRDIMVALLSRHPKEKGEWATFAELNIATGYQGQNWIDLFCMNCWPSKGYRTVAYEIKVSRNDFMNEIKNPNKRAGAEKLAGECYFAVPANLVSKEEVPATWGLVYIDQNGGCKVVKVATQSTPEPYPMAFIASLARRAADDMTGIKGDLFRFGHNERAISYQELMEIARHGMAGELAQEYRKGYTRGARDIEAKLSRGGKVMSVSSYQSQLVDDTIKQLQELRKEFKRVEKVENGEYLLDKIDEEGTPHA